MALFTFTQSIAIELAMLFYFPSSGYIPVILGNAQLTGV